MRFMRVGGALALLVALAACQPGDRSNTTSTLPVDSLFSNYYTFKKEINPIEATKAGYSAYNHRFANYIASDYKKQLIDRYTDFLAQAERYDSASLTPAQWLSLRVLKWDCAIKREGLSNALATMASPMYDLPNMELTPLLQIQSLHLYIAQLAGGSSVQPFTTVQDYDNWLKRLDGYVPFLDTCMAKMRVGMSRGVVLPKVLVKKMIPQLDGFARAPLEAHVFYAPIRQMPAEFSADDQQRLTAAYTELVNDRLKPKYQELQDFLTNTYLPAGRETAGLGALPNGPETYRYLLRLHTTTHLTADEIHELGLREVSRIEQEMEQVKQTLGFQGTLREFFAHVRSNPRLMPFAKPEEVIANFNRIRSVVEARVTDIFEVKPKAGFKVRRTEAFREASASAEYVPGSKDASRPGTFYVPIPDVKTYNLFADEALFLHEAVPGHHYQLSLQQENTQLPEFLHPESMGVFVEGWALYAESLGKELGLYTDPYQYFGMLSMEMHRAIRLVVDTGIHAKGWTREEAIRYSLDHEAESEDDITAEIERYMATPGQAVSYKIGQLKIKELRQRAQTALGADFSLREFHTQVLNSGSLPLVLLEEKINGWIAAKKGV